MFSLLLNPLTVLIASAVGYAALAAAGVNRHGHELLLASGVLVIAGLLSSGPLYMARKSDQLAVAQAGLVSSLLHMLLAIAGGGVLMFVLRPHQSFAWWLCALYCVSLTALVVTLVRSVKSAPARTIPTHTPTGI